MKLLKKFSIIMLSIIIFIFLIEGTLHIFSFISDKRKLSSENDKTKKTVICLGDSITYGPGQVEISFPKILEKKINSNSNKRFRVLNLGDPGLDSEAAFEEIKIYTDLYKPDIITLMVGACNTDLYIDPEDDDESFKENKSIIEKTRIYKLLKMLKIQYTGYSQLKKQEQCEVEPIIKKTELRTITPDNNIVKSPKVFFDKAFYINKNKGWEYVYKNNFRKAEEFFIFHTDEIENLYGLLYVYISSEQINKALNILEKYTKIFEKDVVADLFKGYAYMLKFNMVDALDVFEKLYIKNKGNINAILGIANIYIEVEKYDLAEAWLNKAMELMPDYGEIYNNFGYFYDSKDEVDRSLKMYIKGTEVDNNNYENYQDAGYVYSLLDKKDKAIEYFNKAIKINKYDYESYKGKAIILLSSSDKDDVIESQQLFIKSRELNPNNYSIEKKLRTDLLKIIDHTRKNGIKLFFINYPQSDNYIMRTLSKEENIPYIDIYKVFSEKVSMNDSFPNKYFVSGKICSVDGNSLIADTIYKSFSENGVLK